MRALAASKTRLGVRELANTATVRPGTASKVLDLGARKAWCLEQRRVLSSRSESAPSSGAGRETIAARNEHVLEPYDAKLLTDA